MKLESKEPDFEPIPPNFIKPENSVTITIEEAIERYKDVLSDQKLKHLQNLQTKNKPL